jgi:alanyl-tRNA synthetase
VTERLYYTDPYLTDFEAEIVDLEPVEGGARVILDRTAFYPTSGGQPFDTGFLGGARVVEVLEEGARIVHVVSGEIPRGHVAGSIDWGRRFEHMQQHTGQHVLSAALDRLAVRTVSFHLGSVAATIDLAREVTAAEITRAEDAANAIVWEDRPVAISFVDAEHAAALPLRKESARTGRLRIIEIDGFDVSACGGTHVARTGSVGVIAVSGWERFKGGSRIEFRCGVRALRAHRALRDTVATAARLMSAGAEELPAGIERLQAENRDGNRRLKDLDARLAGYEADVLAARALEAPAGRVVVEALLEPDLTGLKTRAQRIAARPGHVAILLTGAAPVSVVIARSSDAALDAAALLKQLTAEFGGKGGGRPELAQGGGLDADPATVIDRVHAMLGLGDGGSQRS